MGQSFLISRPVLKKIIESSKLKPQDIVLEIGPGIGTLTQALARKVKKVIAIEKDPRLVEILKEVLEDFKNIKIIQADALKLKKSRFQREKIKNYKVVSNLPYNIATEVIKRFLATDNPPKLMVVMVQKEVGQRICSQPPKMQRLGVLVQARADVKIIETVKKDSFWPQPKVNSAILKITPKVYSTIVHDRELWENQKLFQKIVKAGFSQPRKQLVNNFSKSLSIPREKVEQWLKQNNIAPAQRAQSLTLENWLNLSKTFIAG